MQTALTPNPNGTETATLRLDKQMADKQCVHLPCEPKRTTTLQICTVNSVEAYNLKGELNHQKNG